MVRTAPGTARRSDEDEAVVARSRRVSPISTDRRRRRGARRLHDQRVDVDARDVGSIGGELAEADEELDQLTAVDRGLSPRNSPSRRLGREPVDHVDRVGLRRAVRDGTPRRQPLRRGCHRHRASPSRRTVRRERPRRSARGCPTIIGATSTSTSPSSGAPPRAARRCGLSTAARSPSRSLTRPRSVLWAMASPFSLATTGYPISSAASPAPPPW